MATTNTLRGLTYVPAPAGRQVRPGGLLSVAEIRDAGIGAAELRGYAFETEAAIAGGIYDYSTNSGSPLSFQSGITVQQALTSFEVYATAEINALFAGEYDPEIRAALRLEQNESRLAEKEFELAFLAALATDITPTPGTAVRPAIALAVLAQYAADHYGFLPTLHLSVRAALQLGEPFGLVEFSDGRARLVADGSPIVVGTGYSGSKPWSAAAVPTADQQYLYATGSVLLYRSAVETDRGSQYLDTNGDHAIAFRTYVPSIETFAVAVLTDLA